MKTLTIQGMHCDACQKLIKMELDDAGFENAIKGGRQVSDNIGELYIADNVSDDDVRKIAEVINNMDAYTFNENL